MRFSRRGAIQIYVYLFTFTFTFTHQLHRSGLDPEPGPEPGKVRRTEPDVLALSYTTNSAIGYVNVALMLRSDDEQIA